MKDNITESLAHTKWNCKYHIVFAPKYRRKVFFDEKRKEIREILRTLCKWNVSSGVERSNTSSAALIVCENGKITGVTVSPENTSVPKGGQRQFTATVIGYGDFDEAELTIPIDPNAHDFGAWIAEVPATCAATGTKGHKDCNRCNRHYDESGNEITDLTIPTNDNHDWNAWTSNSDGTHTRTCKRDSNHKENGTCSGGTATCTTKAVCNVCRTTYGGFAPHNTTQYNGKDSSGHWDTCSTCDNKFNFEAHTPDREKADETNPVKCTKCGFVITPAGHYEHTADSEWHNSADGKYHFHKCTQDKCKNPLFLD